MAESCMVPKGFAKLHKKHNTPINALLLIGALSVIAPFFGKAMLVWMVDAANFACCLAYCMISVSFLVLRKKFPGMVRPYKVKHYKVSGVIATAMSGTMALMYLLPGTGCTLLPQEWGFVIGWTILGVCFYLWSRQKYGDKAVSNMKTMQRGDPING